MTSELLNSKDIFVIDWDNRLWLYSPQTGIIAEASAEEIASFESILFNGEIPPELKPMIGKIDYGLIDNPDTISELTILINQRCNFSCKYCYSAKGRSNAELPQELFDTIVDWFVDPEKRGEHLNVTFSGGGDPTLSMEKIKLLISKFKKKASERNAEIQFGMVCNGSMIHPKDIKFIKSNIDNIVISFDVIEDVHNTQRSHYNIVAETMYALLAAGVDFGIRSTVTDANVDRLEEMVEVLHRDFPDCHSMAMEAVLSSDLWTDNSCLESFHIRFVDNYFKAKKLAETYGIDLGNTIENSVGGLKSRPCQGKVVVTPEGRLTACSRVATPGDKFFDNFVFGSVNEFTVTYDLEKYERIMAVRAERFDECKKCFARYHCGGGCMLARLSYSSAQMESHCIFTKLILKQKLFDGLD